MQSRIVPIIIVGVIVLVLSLWLGQGIAQNQLQTLLTAGAGAGLLVCLMLGQRVWIAMIMLLAMPVPIMRGFHAPELGQMIFVGMSLIMFMMHKLKLNWKYTEMDLWRILLLLCIVQVYARNPVGLNILGASSVGARPYFNVALALLAGFILSKYVVQPKEIRWAMWASILGYIITLPLNTFRYGFGRGPAVETVSVTTGYEGEGAGRVGKYNTWAQCLSIFISSRVNPLRAAFHPVWAFLILLSLALAALSGYRNTVAYVGIAFLLGIAYRGGALSVFTSTVIGAFALGVLAMVNLAYPLPLNVQRALSPFPGTWDERQVEQAERSTEWRIEMWRQALLTDDWIKNKIFGDGLGMTREEHERMQALDSRQGARAIESGLTRQQEGMMLTGNYHSGPLQTIRTIGYIGLLIMVLAMIRMMVHTHRLITRARNTEWFVPVMFFSIMIMVWPPFWAFIFGEFRTGVFHVFMWSGMIDLMHKNLPLPVWVRQPRHHVPLATRNLPEPMHAQTRVTAR